MYVQGRLTQMKNDSCLFSAYFKFLDKYLKEIDHEVFFATNSVLSSQEEKLKKQLRLYDGKV